MKVGDLVRDNFQALGEPYHIGIIVGFCHDAILKEDVCIVHWTDGGEGLRRRVHLKKIKKYLTNSNQHVSGNCNQQKGDKSGS